MESHGANVDAARDRLGLTPGGPWNSLADPPPFQCPSLPAVSPEDAARREAVAKASAMRHEDVVQRRVVPAVAWHDRLAIEGCDEIPALPDGSYDVYRGAVPRYAIERGLTIETCRAWDLGHDRRGKRLVFPLIDHKGRLVATSGRLYACQKCGWRWGARDKQPKECGSCGAKLPPKFMHSRGFRRDRFLYGEHRRHVDRGWLVYVVEGNMDAPLLWQLGYRPVVATLGSNVSPIQVEKLVAWWDHALIVQDADAAGDDMVRLVRHMVAGRMKVSSVRPSDGRDPGDLTADEARELLGEPPA